MINPLHVPDPSGPPEPIQDFPRWLVSTLGVVGTVAISAGAVLSLLVAFPTRTAGARRSVCLKWQERRQQVEQQLREQTRAAIPRISDVQSVGQGE